MLTTFIFNLKLPHGVCYLLQKHKKQIGKVNRPEESFYHIITGYKRNGNGHMNVSYRSSSNCRLRNMSCILGIWFLYPYFSQNGAAYLRNSMI